jgi:cell division protein FtsA
VVLTGGGSMLDGLVELAEDILGMPVRPGLPQSVAGLTEDLTHPVYATAIGLASYASQPAGENKDEAGKKKSSLRLADRFLSWIGK